MVYWSLLHVYVPLKENNLLYSHSVSKVRLERDMEELTPNWHGIGLEEQKLLKGRVDMLHFYIDQGYSTTTPLAGHLVKQSAASAFLPKIPCR